jgi:hypothetical protein
MRSERTRRGYRLTAGELAGVVSEDGIVNLTLLHDLCINRLWDIERARQGSGRRTRRSVGMLARQVESFLRGKGLAELSGMGCHIAAKPSVSRAGWFWDQPHAEFSLQLNAEGGA